MTDDRDEPGDDQLGHPDRCPHCHHEWWCVEVDWPKNGPVTASIVCNNCGHAPDETGVDVPLDAKSADIDQFVTELVDDA